MVQIHLIHIKFILKLQGLFHLYILKNFFRSSDANKRVPIEIDNISKDNEKGGIDAFRIPCDIKQL